MKNLAIAAAAFALACSAVSAADEPAGAVSDTEIWNEGVSYYLNGDVTNAVRVLRPLMLSREYGARAAEVVAKVAHDRAHTPGAEDALAALEESAAAAQIALRAAPGDERAERNFSRAVEGLAELRETKRVNDVLKAGEKRDAASILGDAMRAARSMMAEAAGLSTNAAEMAVAKADALSARALGLCDAWLQANAAISQAVTNQEQAATISVQVNQARERTEAAAKALGDLAEDAYSKIADSERDFTQFFKLTVLPPEAMREDLTAQSNALTGAESVNGRDWQREALEFTRAFSMKFPAWAQAYEQQAAADTNKPPFTAETQKRIAELALGLEKRQISCCENPLPQVQEECLATIREILELLPKDGGGSQSQKQNQKQDQKQNQDQDRQGGQNQQQNQEGSGEDDRQKSDQKQEESPQEEGKQDEREAQGEEEKTPEDKEVEALLKKAQERNDEYESEKRARIRKAPLPPNERDW